MFSFFCFFPLFSFFVELVLTESKNAQRELDVINQMSIMNEGSEDVVNIHALKMKLESLDKLMDKYANTQTAKKAKLNKCFLRLRHTGLFKEKQDEAELLGKVLLEHKNQPKVITYSVLTNCLNESFKHLQNNNKDEILIFKRIKNSLSEIAKNSERSYLGSELFYLLGKLESGDEFFYDLSTGYHRIDERFTNEKGNDKKAMEYFKKSMEMAANPDQYARSLLNYSFALKEVKGEEVSETELRKNYREILGLTDNVELIDYAQLELGHLYLYSGEFTAANMLFDEVINRHEGSESPRKTEAEAKKFQSSLNKFVEGLF